jgi:hypothetical protein
MTLDRTDLLTSEKLQPIMERLGVEAKAKWVELTDKKWRLFFNFGRCHETDRIQWICPDGAFIWHYFKTGKEVSAYSADELWEALPEWLKSSVINLLSCLTDNNEIACRLGVDIDKYKAWDYFSTLIRIHKGNWLKIWAEIILYLEGKGLMG